MENESIYYDNKSDLEFKCEVGHRFHRTWSEVKTHFDGVQNALQTN